MTADNLLLFLEQPDKLSRVSYQELKTLVMEYPYFAHAHQLLLFKCKLSEHKDYAQDLNRAAAHSVDRAQLRLQLRRLDLTDALPPKPLVNPVAEADTLPPAEALIPETELPTIAAEPEAAQALTLPEPLDKKNFRTWHRRPGISLPFSSPNQLHVGQPPEQTPTQENASTLPDYNQRAVSSLVENREIISASLAALLARQGHRDKAIEMYGRLSLIFPEKSTYFAAQIEKLKNN
jgi:hypothetical protein